MELIKLAEQNNAKQLEDFKVSRIAHLLSVKANFEQDFAKALEEVKNLEVLDWGAGSFTWSRSGNLGACCKG